MTEDIADYVRVVKEAILKKMELRKTRISSTRPSQERRRKNVHSNYKSMKILYDSLIKISPITLGWLKKKF